MPLTLAEIIRGRSRVVTALEDELVSDAMGRMIDHGYSQLPVVQHDGKGDRPVGLISMTSIARAVLHVGLVPSEIRVSHACERKLATASSTSMFWDAIDEARAGRALLVVDGEGYLQGLLTDFDLAEHLRHLTADGLAVADVEARVREFVQFGYSSLGSDLEDAVLRHVRGQHHASFSSVRKVVLACCGGVEPPRNEIIRSAFEECFLTDVVADFDRLNFSQYIDMFVGADCWPCYEAKLGVPKAQIRELLGSVREYRNRLAHHRGTLTAVERDRLVFCRDLLNRIGDLVSDVPIDDPEKTECVVDAVLGGESSVAAMHLSDEILEPSYDRRGADGVSLRVPLDLRFARIRADRVTKTFGSLGAGLPAAARNHRSWWSNDEDVDHARDWLDQGWRVVSVNLTAETVTFGRNSAREAQYLRVFGSLFRSLSDCEGWPAGVVSPSGRSWQAIAALPENGPQTARMILSFTETKKQFRIELYIDAQDKSVNKATFDELAKVGATLQGELGETLVWDRLDEKRACRVAIFYPNEISVDGDEEDYTRLADWLCSVAPRFRSLLTKYYRTVH